MDRIEALREGTCFPSQIQIVLSDLCNQNCNFCAYRSENGFNSEFFGGNPNRMLPTETVLKILDDLKGKVSAVQFTGGGEPLLHKDHLMIFTYAHFLGYKMGLVTNGTKFSDDSIYSKFDWIRVSLDAGTKDTYEKTRESKLFDRVIRNLENLPKGPVTGVGFVVTKDNYHEIRQAVELCNGKVDYIRFSAVFGDDSDYGQIYHRIKATIENCKEDFDIEIYDLFGERVDDLKQGSPDYEFCGYQYFNTYIGGNQKVYRCCTTAYTPHGEIGDLTKESITDILSRERPLDARECKICQFNDKNKVINYLIGTPVHVDFV